MKIQEVFSGFKWVKLGFLFSIALVISLFGMFPEAVEYYYASNWYPAIGSSLRTITKQIPFSLGDIVYFFIAIMLIINLIRLITWIVQRKMTKARITHLLFYTISTLLWFYILFKLFWGLNYDRLGIAYQLKLPKENYTKEEVTTLALSLIDKLNECRRQIPDSVLPKPQLDSIYREAYRAYMTVSLNQEYLNYRNRSVKESLFTGIGDYMGFTGYYNPFTGEAQLRSDIPRILIPYVACHEMAHQLGYASESEANFVGYLAASSSKNVYVRYSVYLDLFSYAQGEQIMLYGKENDYQSFEKIIKQNRECMDTLVKKDRKEIREFFFKRKNRISPAVGSIYDQYLKLNKQTEGLNSYNEVIGLLLAYQKKYGKL